MKKARGEQMEEILTKIRLINQVIREKEITNFDNTEDFPFQTLIQELGQILVANTYMIDIDGKVLGYYAHFNAINSERTNAMFVAKQLDTEYMRLIKEVQETKENIPTDNDQTIFALELRNQFKKGMTTIIPIFGGSQKIGYLVLARQSHTFNDSDLILGEYVSTVVALEMIFHRRQIEEAKKQEKENVVASLQTLSYSELNALNGIFKYADTPTFRITASRVAKEENITRSVIVNALRKMESAGVLISRSLGMKGTLIDTRTEENLDYIKKQIKKEI